MKLCLSHPAVLLYPLALAQYNLGVIQAAMAAMAGFLVGDGKLYPPGGPRM